MKTTKKIFIVLKILTLAFGGIAFAANNDGIMSETKQSDAYLVALNTFSVPSLEEQVQPTMFQDMFVVAQNNNIHSVTSEMYVSSTGYNSDVGQTDDSPFIAADGTHVYDGMVAANFLPFGTKIMLPDEFPGKVFTVHDRMNKRFSQRVDVWFPQHGQAIQWGLRTVKIEILES